VHSSLLFAYAHGCGTPRDVPAALAIHCRVAVGIDADALAD
jgi:hypothetical protein